MADRYLGRQSLSMSSEVTADLLDEQAINKRHFLCRLLLVGRLGLVNSIIYGYVLKRTEMLKNTITDTVARWM